MDPNFTRDQSDYGTDIFVLGFKGGDDWKHSMVASILDGFLYAVYTGKLIVDVDGIEVSKDTLSDLMETYKGYFREHADEYYQALTNRKAGRSFSTELSDDPETAGKLTLHLLIEPEFHRRAAMVRQTGMKIKDKGNISGLIPFAGVLFIEGDAINSYLRSMENPQHLEWEIERASNKAKAKRVLSYLTRFIKNSLDEMRNDDSEEELDPLVGEYLSAADDMEDKNQDKTEDITDKIKDVKIKITEIKPKPADSQSGKEESTEVDDPEGDIIVEDVPGEGGSGNQGSNGGGGNGGGSTPGNGGGKEPVEHRKSLSSILPASVRNVVRNKDQGKYTIIFTPSVSADTGVIDLLMSAESQNYEASLLNASCNGEKLKVSGNRITGLKFEAEHPMKIDIQIDYSDYCPLEVKAYGNKI